MRMAEKHEERLVLYKQGMTDKEIAETLDYTDGAIFRWRKLYGLPAWRKGRWPKE